jgi:hypothetical protein
VSVADEVRSAEREEDLRVALGNALRALERAKTKTEDLIEAVYRAVRDATIADPIRPVKAPKLERGPGKPEVALWHLTDWQGSKVTTSYNSEVMRRRVHAFVDTADRITTMHRSVSPINEVVILYGGDMVEGLFNFPQQPFEIDASLFGQFVRVSNLLAEVVTRALTTHERVTVVAEWGNHGRVGSKRDVVPRADNIDRMCYEAARMMLGRQERLTWVDSAEDIQRVEIGNYRALLMHGDETGRAGYVSTNTFLTYLTKLKGGGFGWPFRDVYTGHRHTHGEDQFSDGDGRWFRTGSTESDNRYARDGMGVRGTPSQRLHFIDPARGRVTAQYQIELSEVV